MNAAVAEEHDARRSGSLHMGAPPRTVLSHTADGRMRRGRGILFALPAGQYDTSPANFLTALDGRDWKGDAEAELRRRINERARELALPPAALVTEQPQTDDEECRDPLSTLAVLAKSSGHVYLRDKEPNLAALRPGRRVVLVIPPSGDRR
jgi:hypothetical protein